MAVKTKKVKKVKCGTRSAKVVQRKKPVTRKKTNPTTEPKRSITKLIIMASYREKNAFWNGAYWDTDEWNAKEYSTPTSAMSDAKKLQSKVRSGAILTIRPKKR